MKTKPYTLIVSLTAALLAVGVLSTVAQPAVAQPAVAQPAVAQPAVAQPAVAQAVFGSAAESTESVTLSVSALNRVFDSLDTGFVPIEQGPVTIVISSPAHRLEVFANRISLASSEFHQDGVEVLFEVDLEGWGDLIASVQTAVGSTPYQDRVVVERQWVKAEAVVKLVITETGYDMTFLEALTPTVGFQIESNMAREIVETCLAFTALLPGLGCDGVSASLARIEVPLPAAGTQYEIDASFLTEQERAVLNQFALPPIKPETTG